MIYLDDYRMPRSPRLATSRSNEDLLGVNRSPAFGVVALSRGGTSREPSPRLPDEFESVDMRALLARLRALASQI